MEHLEWHQHAFIDKDNKVLNVLVFDESAHDSTILDDAMKTMPDAVQTICCCAFELCGVGDTWDGSNFRPAPLYSSWVWDANKKSWIAPSPMPIDGGIYNWDEDTLSWKETIPE